MVNKSLEGVRSRMVFRNEGFVMIYSVTSEMSQSVPILLSRPTNIYDKRI